MGANAEEVKAPAVLRLRPLRGQGIETWSAQLTDGLFTLNGPDDRLVMMLPTEAAASHIRLQRDLVHGDTIRIYVLEGLKAHTFKLTRADRETLLNWLPNRDGAELAQEVRLYGVAFFLLATAHLLFQELLYWGWGLAFAGAGVAAVLSPHRRMYLVNGTMLGFVGLMLLFGDPFPRTSQLALTLYTMLGSLYLLWSIQQFSLLGPHHRLRAAGTGQRESLSTRHRHQSRLVRAVAGCAAILAILLGAYAAAIHTAASPDAPPQHDFMIFAGLAVLLAFASVVLFLRRYPPYLEAKIAAQLMIATAVIYAWGLTAGYALGDPLAFTRGVLAAGLLRFDRPYVWAPLLVLLLLFGRWFVAAAERDARQQGEGD